MKKTPTTEIPEAPLEETAPQVEEPAEEPVPEVSDPDAQEEPAACQTSDHMKTYPMVQETSTFVNEFPITKAIINTSSPIFKPVGEFIHSQSLLKPIVRTVDGFGVSTLTTAENWCPSIKSATWNDLLVSVKKPIVHTDEMIKNASIATNDCIENNVLTPTRKFVRDGRAYYNEHLYDTKGKPLLRSSLDPVFRPVNYQLENFTLTNLPEGEPISTEYTSEIEKNVYLSINLVERSIPVIGNKVVETVMVPCNYTLHVFDVYNENLEKQGETPITSSVMATYNTSLDLTNEVSSEIVSLWNKVWPKKEEEPSSPSAEEQDQPPVVEEAEQTIEAIDPIPVVA